MNANTLDNSMSDIESNCSSLKSVGEFHGTDNELYLYVIFGRGDVYQDIEFLSQYSHLVGSIQLESAQVDDSLVRCLAKFKNLQSLCLTECVITSSLSELESLNFLNSLSVSGSMIGLDCWQSISSLSQLESLFASNSSLSNQSLESLAKLTKLKRLSIGSTGVSNASLQTLVRFPLLEDIDEDCFTQDERLWLLVHLPVFATKFNRLRAWYETHGDFKGYPNRDLVTPNDD